MFNFVKKIDNILERKGLTRYKVAKLINCSDSALNQMIRAERSFSKTIKNKLIPILECTKEEFESWILADQYSKEVLKQAAIIKTKSKLKKKQLILTIKIDETLQLKGMSRTVLSKEIKYSQSGLNRMITGQISLSKSVKERIAPILEVSEDEITSWVVADKYDIEVIELAIKELDINNL